MFKKLVTKPASTLVPGDSFESHGTLVTVLKPPEPTKDLFGRKIMRVWCSRADTRAEGWMQFGVTGIVLAPADDDE